MPQQIPATFVIKINGVTDTIEFQYSSYPHLISKECGYTFYHHLDTVTNFTKHIIKRYLYKQHYNYKFKC